VGKRSLSKRLWSTRRVVHQVRQIHQPIGPAARCGTGCHRERGGERPGAVRPRGDNMLRLRRRGACAPSVGEL